MSNRRIEKRLELERQGRNERSEGGTTRGWIAERESLREEIEIKVP